jgi:flavin-dependent dehydrogenase
MKQSELRADVFIVGGGPAGLAAAIAARQQGLQVVVADRQQPPIDKACGEGLMPGAVAALQDLGVSFSPREAMVFRGIRFLDAQTGLCTQAEFRQGTGMAVRRTVLHARLVKRAAEMGAVLMWGAQASSSGGGRVACDGRNVESRWIIGADGLRSHVREWAGLQPKRRERLRFGFRQHFQTAPWSDFVEVYWGPSCQVAVTPVGTGEVGLAVVSRRPETRLQQALQEMPVLAARLGPARELSRERGAPSAARRLPALHRGRFALIGDASGSVDPVTGEGLGLAFRQAVALAGAMRQGELGSYQSAHARIGRTPYWMSRLILCMDKSAWLRRRALRALADEPELFAKILSAQAESTGPLPMAAADALRLGWRLAKPGWQV